MTVTKACGHTHSAAARHRDKKIVVASPEVLYAHLKHAGNFQPYRSYVVFMFTLQQFLPVYSRIDRSDSFPTHCRIVSRGKLSNQASDFGGLEVFAGASIGHTDPFVLASVLQQNMHEVLSCP